MAKVCKFYKQKRQVSYDNGVTWQDVVPAEYQRGDLYEYESPDCGVVIVYRWVNMDASVDYYCEGTTKYYKQKKQVSYDGGQTWQDVVPAEYQRGGVAEAQSTDCGYVPPTPQYRWVKSDDTICVESPVPPTGNKLVAQYTGGVTREVQCNGDDTLTTGETRPYNWDFSGMTSAIIGNCVTNIDDRAFYYYFYEFSGLPHLRWVTIPNSVTTIGNNAFSCCYNLISAPIPDSVTEIGNSAFNKCKKLESINIPSGITSIGNYAFSGCGNAGGSVVIPDSLSSLGSGTFWGCHSLTSITISNSITNIGDGAFYGCSGLTSITCLATTPPTLGSNVFEYTNDCDIYVPCDSVADYKEYWSDYSSRIQGIPPCEPDPQYRWVNMDASVDYYCEGTTKYYKQKKQVSYDDGQTWQDVSPAEYQKGSVAEAQSTDCGYVPPTPPTGKKFVGTYSGGQTLEVECNSSTELTSSETGSRRPEARHMVNAAIGQCVTTIGFSAFEECNDLASVSIPDSVTTIGERAFFDCFNLTSVTIPNRVTLIDYQAFTGCSGLTSINIPDSVTAIGNNAFAYCDNLTSVSMSNSVTSIGEGTFVRCGFTNIIIPDSVATIGRNAFIYCSGLTSVTVNAVTPPTLGNNAFYDTNNCPIYVPASSVNAYKSASGWSTYASRIQAIP